MKKVDNPKVKIFLSYHKPTKLLKNGVFQPIHVGRAIAQENIITTEQKQNYKWMKDNLIGDDTGDNISHKNPNYCELTAQYWAWKNFAEIQNPDYIGFMHYRRHLNFNLDKEYSENKWGTIDNNYLDESYIEKYGLNERNVEEIIRQYDILTVNPWSVNNAGSKNNYDHYATSDPKIHIKDYDLTLKILQQKYPEYKIDIQKYNASEKGYYTNIFIMRKYIFNQYCQWLFDILFEVEKRVDISNYSFQEARIFGYLSEWLFGIYITHIKRTTKLKIKELQRTIIKYPELDKTSSAKRDKILFISSITPHIRHDEDLKRAYGLVGGNTGNLVYRSYTKEYLVYDIDKSVEILNINDLNNLSDIDKNFDKIVILCANQLSPTDKYLLQFYDFLNETKLPIVLLGLGAQSDIGYSMDFLKDCQKMVCFLKMLQRKKAKIGVRGYFTKHCLDKIGVNSTVIGCPSYYRNGYYFKVEHNKNKHPRFNVSCDYFWFKKKVINNHLSTQIICQSRMEDGLYLLSKGAASNTDIEQVNRLFNNNEKYTNKNNQFLGRCHRFFNIDEWEKFVASGDFYIGPRIHGCLIHILNGKQAMLVVHDSRTREFAELFKIPYITDLELTSDLDINKLYQQYSPLEMEKQYSCLFENYRKFLTSAGLAANFYTDINICFATDDNYAKYMGIAITSILRHKLPFDNIHIYVLDGGISQKNKDKLAKLQKIAKFNITFIKMNDEVFHKYPLRGNPHFTYATYYRLVLPTLLPNVDKLIYLDCDIIVRNSLATLMNEDMENNLCKGVIDVLNVENQNRLHLDKYVNAGVLLINLKKWRQYDVWQKFKTYLEQHFDEILWNDQDIMNAVLKGKIDYLDQRWNTQLTEYEGGRTEEFREIGEKAFIMHFISDKKPWKFCKSKYEQYYFQEALHSPWKDGWIIHIINRLTREMIKLSKILFSVENSQPKKHKIITIFGIKIKFRRKLYPLECKITQMQHQIYELNIKIQELVAERSQKGSE